jgi:hypothetical protein
MDSLAGVSAWLGSLEPGFAFLLALPFIVAIAGLLAGWARHRRGMKSAGRN